MWGMEILSVVLYVCDTWSFMLLMKGTIHWAYLRLDDEENMWK
jgi:hypothetical protein